ncbi:sugar ABC transporter substrate-binding protein [Limobrevibacterium gyesilva]|uniref:Sugar ABC transporter substrate-binding protein n=1 Tax=Limobrevibacterium gyesilva TaxID=2991712 RepID=A0AA41YPY9_9PROT|nr:sugar ABC transporter substrate-binding protein [Limobrevibacterium gyesilva]MCW3477921.1 sugar ABC transporter substrate-binding protein [Limobrevibacterium gyesilva]
MNDPHELDTETHDASGNVARRMLLGGAVLGTALAAMSVRATQARAAGFPAHPKWKLVFVNHVTTNPFFVPTRYGIEDACALLGCEYQWTGSATSNAAEMVNAMNTAIAGKADAIAVPIVDQAAFNRPIASAMEAGIAVFSYNADVPSAGRLAYIGQDLYASGAKMGERILGMIDSGRVALFIATPGQLNIQPRIDGAQDVIRKAGRNITVDVIATGPTVDEELSKIDAYYIGHQDVKGMFAVDAGSTQGVSQVIKKYKLPEKGIKGGGYDLLPVTLNNIRDGFLDFTIDQQPYLQGFYTVMVMATFLASGGLVGPADINTGLKFVTKDSVGPYITTSTRYEGKTDRPMIVPRSGAIKG